MTNSNSDYSNNAFACIRLAIYTLIRYGVPLEDIVANLNRIIQELINSDDITLLSTDSLGMVKDGYAKKLGDISFDMSRNTVLYGDQRVKLTPNASLLLDIFMNNPGKLLSHQEIVDHVVGDTDNSPAEVC